MTRIRRDLRAYEENARKNGKRVTWRESLRVSRLRVSRASRGKSDTCDIQIDY